MNAGVSLFWRQKKAVAGLVIIVTLCLMALFAP